MFNYLLLSLSRRNSSLYLAVDVADEPLLCLIQGVVELCSAFVQVNKV